MRQLPTIAAAIALAAGPALVPALSLADEARAETPKAAEEGGVAVSQTLATLPGTSIPAVGVGVAGALGFAALALGTGGSTNTTSTTGTN
ncbi:hypothetical protein SAMN05444336_103459 [Albimonas donghaensis]|uniref:Secreted protein n=1 Tax=Albimonas donghaensis TaxID=356660 RepID=A0A1H2ZF27_9RHOB|nr:hypothetical protein [Albimonas donghaensis]SDX15339.1 hypothetical protein SAMN05444336_103459 [Albimonas donghaensis]